MIHKFIFPLLAAILLSSCANHFSLVKRKYTKGYYVSFTKKHSSSKKEPEGKAFLVKEQTPENITVKPGTVYTLKNDRPVLASAQEMASLQAEASKSRHSKAMRTKTGPIPLPQHSMVPVNPKEINDAGTEAYVLSRLAKQNKAAQGSESGATFIVLVILCFFWFLNLISVYIHDGRKCTINFLVTLLLDFTFIGGLIFSLLVVLDVVDLTK